MVKVCAIYVRKSKINDNSDSMETQIQMCTEYLERKYKDCIIKIYDKDYGVTGHSIEKRKDFQRMMNDIKSGLINLVAVQRYDRIARNTRDFCNIYHDIRESGCELVCVSQDLDTTTASGKNVMYIQASMAEFEWDMNSDRRKDVNRYARLNKKCNLSPYALPFGIKAEIRDGKRVAVIDKEVEHIVRDAIDYYKKSESKRETTRYINEKYGLNKSHSFMDNLIKSDFYHGSYREVDNYCEAYMTEEEHEELKKISKRYVRHYTSDKNYFLFTGLLRCPVCGLKMESQSQVNTSGNHYYYYRCHNTYRTGNCTFKGNINEKAVEDYLKTHIFDEIKKFSVSFNYSSTKDKKVVNLAKYKEELQRLTNAYLKGRIDEEFYDSEYEKIQKIIKENELNSVSKNKFDADSLAETFNQDWLTIYDQLTRENKRTFWKNVIKQVNFNDDKTIKSVDFL